MDDKKIALFKNVLKDNPKEFDFKELIEGATDQMINAAKEEAISAIRRLMESVFYEMREKHNAELQVKKLDESITKKQAKIVEIKKGNLDVLFAKDGGTKPEEKKEE